MIYADLERFLLREMRMQHIYQPLVVLALIEAGGAASIPRIASTFHPQDEKHRAWLESKLRSMPIPVLGKAGVLTLQGDVAALTLEQLLPWQAEDLRSLCQQLSADFARRRDVDVWDSRLVDGVSSCPFCSFETRRRSSMAQGAVYAVDDRYPVSEGHTLIITKLHRASVLDMTDQEGADAHGLIGRIIDGVRSRDDSVSGFNVGFNDGVSAGQTVPHAHVHVIPRRDGDVADPSGGVRGAVPDEMHYDTTDGR